MKLEKDLMALVGTEENKAQLTWKKMVLLINDIGSMSRSEKN